MKNTMTTQEDLLGCGVACVAFVAGVPYAEAIKFTTKDRATNYGFYLKDLQEILEKYGLEYSRRYVTPKVANDIYQDGTLVFVKRSKLYPAGHYLIRHDGMWGDPWLNFRRSKNVAEATSGFRKRLPGKAQYALIPAKF